MKANELNSKPSNQPLAHNLHHRKDVNDIVTRQHMLAEIIFKLNSEHKPCGPKVLLKLMKEKGYDVDRSTICRDRLAINRRNNFLKDLAESNYSFYIESMWSDIEFVIQGAHQMFINAKNGMSKIHAVKLILDTVKAKHELLNGRVLDVSVELLGKKLHKLKDENKVLREQLASHDSV